MACLLTRCGSEDACLKPALARADSLRTQLVPTNPKQFLLRARLAINDTRWDPRPVWHPTQRQHLRATDRPHVEEHREARVRIAEHPRFTSTRPDGPEGDITLDVRSRGSFANAGLAAAELTS